MPQNLSEWLGVSGFVLAAVGLLLQLLQYRHGKKTREEDTAERVDVKLRTQGATPGTGLWLVATVVNTGRIPVHISGIQLEWGPDKPALGQTTYSIPLRAISGTTSAIEPGDKCEYFLPLDYVLIRRFAANAPGEPRLVARSNQGEIGRIIGEEVNAYLNAGAA